MNTRLLTRLLAMALLYALGQGLALADPSKIPIRDFFRTPAIASPAMSPSGNRIAMLVATDKGRMGLAVADVRTPTRFTGVAQFEDADVRSFQWASDDRLVFDAIDLQAGLGEQKGTGLYAVNADGTDFLWLIERTGRYRVTGIPAVRPLSARHRLFAVTRDGSGDVIIERINVGENRLMASTTLLRLNTRTNTTRPVMAFAPDNAQAWVVDRNQLPRAAMSYDDKGVVSIMLRQGDGDEWVTVARYDNYDPPAGSFTPLAFDHDRRLYVVARQDNPEKTSALFRFDPVKRALEDKPVVNLKGFDFEGQLLFDDRNQVLLGVRFVSDAPGTVWLHDGMKAVQAAVDKLLPNTVNQISCTRCVQTELFIVSATSDRQSPAYFLFDKTSGKLQLLGATRPWLDSRQMAERDFVRIKARDGLEFPVHVTKPKGKGPFPTVVMIHGGPYVRGGVWGFDPDSQFLASRGFLVIEPEFRGSTGYGETLFRAGWKQWGLKMQDDMTDATRWAIAQGLADPKRIAIAGGSYGGYAAMMGVLREPELYRSAVNIVGVTDIELMYDIGWSDFAGSTWQRYGMPRLVGDAKKDAEQLKQTSPLQQAARIKRPVLMAYGEDDLRVPLPHGTKMRDALLASGNKDVEWVQYENEGHGFLLEKNRVDSWGRIERFLQRTLQ